MRVEPGSPAEKAGLNVGDQIVQVNRSTPKDFIQCTELLSDSPRGEARLAVARQRERRDLTARMIPLAELIRQKIGARVQKLTRELAEQFGYEPGSGLLIADVESDGPVARAELQPGNLIAGIDGRSTTDLLSAASLLAGKKKDERTDLTVLVRQRRAGFSRVTQVTVAVRIR